MAIAEVWVEALGCRRVDVGSDLHEQKTRLDAVEGVYKNAVSDGLKRALRGFGDQFGNRLYEKKQQSRHQEARSDDWGERRPPQQGQQESYPATCAACGVETTVPFRPRHDKPIFCRECYRKQ